MEFITLLIPLLVRIVVQLHQFLQKSAVQAQPTQVSTLNSCIHNVHMFMHMRMMMQLVSKCAHRTPPIIGPSSVLLVVLLLLLHLRRPHLHRRHRHRHRARVPLETLCLAR